MKSKPELKSKSEKDKAISLKFGVFPTEIAAFIFSFLPFYILASIREVCKNWNEWIKQELEKESFCKNSLLEDDLFGWQNILRHYSAKNREWKNKKPKKYEMRVAKTTNTISVQTSINSNFICVHSSINYHKQECAIIYPKDNHFEKITIPGINLNIEYNDRGDVFLHMNHHGITKIHRFSFYEKEIHDEIVLDLPENTSFFMRVIGNVITVKENSFAPKSKISFYLIPLQLWGKGNAKPTIIHHQIEHKMNAILYFDNKIFFESSDTKILSCYQIGDEKLSFIKNLSYKNTQDNSFFTINGGIYRYWTGDKDEKCKDEERIVYFYRLEDGKIFSKKIEKKMTPFDKKTDTIVLCYIDGYGWKICFSKTNSFELQNSLFEFDDLNYHISKYRGKVFFFSRETNESNESEKSLEINEINPPSKEKGIEENNNIDSEDFDSQGDSESEEETEEYLSRFANAYMETNKQENTFTEYNDFVLENFIPSKKKPTVFIYDSVLERTKKLLLFPKSTKKCRAFRWLYGFVTFERGDSFETGDKITVYDYFT